MKPLSWSDQNLLRNLWGRDPTRRVPMGGDAQGGMPRRENSYGGGLPRIVVVVNVLTSTTHDSIQYSQALIVSFICS